LEVTVGTDKRIVLVAEDLVKHWEARYAAMEDKAMVVCMSRRICVELYKAIQKLRPDWHHDEDDKGVMKIVMSGSFKSALPLATPDLAVSSPVFSRPVVI
jgi:type I restriction enzyme R subunit